MLATAGSRNDDNKPDAPHLAEPLAFTKIIVAIEEARYKLDIKSLTISRSILSFFLWINLVVVLGYQRIKIGRGPLAIL